MAGLFEGATEITDAAKLKLGNTNVEIYFGSTLLFPAVAQVFNVTVNITGTLTDCTRSTNQLVIPSEGSLQFTVSPTPGHEFTSLTQSTFVDGSPLVSFTRVLSGGSIIYTVTAATLTEDSTINATHDATAVDETFEVSVSITGSNISCVRNVSSLTIPSGQSRTFKVTADNNFEFTSLSDSTALEVSPYIGIQEDLENNVFTYTVTAVTLTADQTASISQTAEAHEVSPNYNFVVSVVDNTGDNLSVLTNNQNYSGPVGTSLAGSRSAIYTQNYTVTSLDIEDNSPHLTSSPNGLVSVGWDGSMPVGGGTATVTVTGTADIFVNVTTASVQNLTTSSGTLTGAINSQGAPADSAGFYWQLLSDGAAAPSAASLVANGTNVNAFSDLSNGFGSMSEGVTFSPSGSQRDLYFVAYGQKSGSDTVFGAVVKGDVPAVSVDQPAVSTGSVSSILETGATFNGTVTDFGNAPSVTSGFFYGTSSNFGTFNAQLGTYTNATKITDNKPPDSEGGSFSEIITGLTDNTQYFVRAWAANSAGYTVGSQVSFTTIQSITLTVAINGPVSFNVSQNYTSTIGGDAQGTITYAWSWNGSNVISIQGASNQANVTLAATGSGGGQLSLTVTRQGITETTAITVSGTGL